MADKLKNEKEILDAIKVLERLFDERIVDLHQVKGAVNYRHNYVHYRKFLFDCQAAVKKGNKKEANEELIQLGEYLRERAEDEEGQKMHTQVKHVFQYYAEKTDQIYNLLNS
jgi:hypothetical protein